MANEKITDYVNLVTTLANGDLLDVSKDTVGDGSVWESQGMTQLVLRTTLGVNGTTNYIPVYDGTKIVPSTIYQSAGGNYGVFGVTTPTFSWSFGGDSLRSIGMERRSGSSASGFAFSVVSGGAAVGSTNQDAGDLQFGTGPSTGNGTGRMTWSLPTPNQGSGTTTRAQSAKMYLLGAGWLGIGQSPSAPLEVFTENTASKMRIGHNLTTIFGSTTTIGIEMARIDNTYAIPLGMYSLSTGHLAIVGGNYGIRLGARPAGSYDFHIGGSQCYIVGGKAPGDGIPYQFYKNVAVADNGNATTITSFETVGSIVTTSITGMHITNTCTSTTTNYGLRLTASGATNNVALHVNTGVITMYTLTPKTGYDFTIASGANRKIGLGVNTLAEAVGNSLTISAGDVFPGYTNVLGGNLILETGISSGNVGSDFIIRTCTPGASGTGTNTLSDKLIVKGNGNVGIGTSTPNAGAILDLTSSTRALLLPRLTGDGASAITPTNGMCLYVTSTNGTFTTVGFWGYEGGAWKKYTLI